MSAVRISGSSGSSAFIYVSSADIAAFISCTRVHTAPLPYKRNFLCPLYLLYFRCSIETEIPLRWSSVFRHSVGHFVWNALSRYASIKEMNDTSKPPFYLAQSHDKHLCTLVVQRCFRVLYTIHRLAARGLLFEFALARSKHLSRVIVKAIEEICGENIILLPAQLVRLLVIDLRPEIFLPKQIGEAGRGSACSISSPMRTHSAISRKCSSSRPAIIRAISFSGCAARAR